MALLKTFAKDNGIVTSYHKISGINLTENELRYDDEGNEVKTFLMDIQLTSFLNELYRKNEQPIETNNYYVELLPEEEISSSIRHLGYLKIKELPEWNDAEDC